jgi:hypothetical protein
MKHGDTAEMPKRQFGARAWSIGTDETSALLEQAQGGVLHQPLGVDAGVGSELREPRFLLGCEVNFHAPRILENTAGGKWTYKRQDNPGKEGNDRILSILGDYLRSVRRVQAPAFLTLAFAPGEMRSSRLGRGVPQKVLLDNLKTAVLAASTR